MRRRVRGNCCWRVATQGVPDRSVQRIRSGGCRISGRSWPRNVLGCRREGRARLGSNAAQRGHRHRPGLRVWSSDYESLGRRRSKGVCHRRGTLARRGVSTQPSRDTRRVRTRRRLIKRIADILVPGGRLLFTSRAGVEPLVWNDAMTGLESRSLGGVVYRTLLCEVGLTVTSEYEDEGQNHYFDAFKAGTATRRPSAAPINPLQPPS